MRILLVVLCEHHKMFYFCVGLCNDFNALNAELNPICHLLALLGAHHIFHFSGLRVIFSCLCVFCIFGRTKRKSKCKVYPRTGHENTEGG